MKKNLLQKLVGIACATALVVTSVAIPMPEVSAAAAEEVVTTGDNTTAMEKDGYSFDHSYVKPGDVLKVLFTEGETSNEVTENINWTVKQVVSGGDTRDHWNNITGETVTYKTVASITAPTLEITEEYLECIIYAEIGETKLTIYCSKTPVIYINSETEYYDVTKEYTNEDTTTINLVGNDTYSDEDYWYNGTGEVKLRGNSTAFRPKRPFKLKLSEKADLLGLGTETDADGKSKSYKSKHWVLLANDIDHSLMRNKLLYDFSGDIGTEVYFDSTNVTLIYNGQYEGVYQLCEHRRVDEGRIDITNWTGLGEDAADTLGKAVAEEKGWSKDTRKEFISELEKLMASDYSWIDEKKVSILSELLVNETEMENDLSDISCEGFASAATEWVTLTGDFIVKMKFHNDGYKDTTTKESHDNFVVEFTNDENTDYLTAVCNGNIWWYGNWRGDLSGTCTDIDMTVLDDADVTLTVKRQGDKITMHADIEGADGSEAEFDASAVNTTGFPETIKLHLTGEQCDVTDISYAIAEHQTFDFEDYDITLPETTGGFLAEMDFYSIGDNTLPSIATSYQQPLYVSAPEPGEDAETDNEKIAIVDSFKETSLYNFAKQYTQTFEYALHSDDFYFRNSNTKYATNNTGNADQNWKNATYSTKTYKDNDNDGKHYSELFDMDSLVNNFIFVEYAMNWDSMKNSFFFYKDIDELGKIGPQWDFDWCWGNTNMYNINTNYPTSWQTTEEAFTVEQYYQTVQWNRMLIRDPYFLTLAYEKYHEVRPIIEDMVKTGGLIDQYREYLSEAGAMNDKRWGYTYSTEYGGARAKGFEDSVSWIQSFLDTRIEWLDNQFASVETLANSLGYYQTSSDMDVTAGIDGENVIFTAKSTNSDVKKIRFQIDGTTLLDATMENSKATVSVPKSKLAADRLHTVVANAVNANGKYIYNTAASKTGNYNVVKSDYMAFEMAKLGNIDQEEGEDNSTDKNPGNENNQEEGNKTEDNKTEADKNNGSGTNVTAPNVTVPNDTEQKVKPAIKLNVSNLKMKKGTSCSGVIVSNLIEGDAVASWKSSKSGVVGVTSKGKLKAKKLGKATITVTTKLGAKAQIKITVIKGNVKTTKITLAKKNVTLKKGKTYTIKPMLTPISSTDKVKYTSSKKKVATVTAKGKVKAKAKGKTIITVKSGKKKIKLTIKVK